MRSLSIRPVETILFFNEKIESLIEKNNYGMAARILLEQQKQQWELLNEGYNSLKTVKLKAFEFDGFKINVQYNPNRIISSSASVDDESVKKRKCFLCFENLPENQLGFFYNREYIILANPYPIFPEHFTIVNVNHFPQRISDIFYIMLSLSQSMSEYYTVFYNGPGCGASAPDHLHFQAGNKNFMPVEKDFLKLQMQYGKILFEENGSKVTAVDDNLRRFITLEGELEEILIYAFCLFFETYCTYQEFEDEPLMNIICSYRDGEGWKVIIFLREKHRPQDYYAEGKENILLSPAAVDLGGICITPRESDFNKITKDRMAELLNEVSLNKEIFNSFSLDLMEKLNKI